MLIPQVSMWHGRRRPDFLVFVPVSRFQYHRVAVLVDRPGKDELKVANETAEYETEGYLVYRVQINDEKGGYFKKARELVSWLENLP